MKVKLISVSEPVGDDMETPQDIISYCARVSNPSNQANFGSSARLLNYLIKEQHWSPFEMVSVCMEIETSRDIARQILRHRSFSFQEFSQRYADPTQESAGLSFVTREARLQDQKNRQNSIKVDDEKLQHDWTMRQQSVMNEALKSYRWAIENGIAKEQARAVLPEGNTNSRLYVNGTLRSWIHFCQLRMGNGTQAEHIEIAKECWYLICKQFPVLEEIQW